MFNDAKGFKRIYLAVGYTDLRNGIEGLATIVKQQFCLDPYEKGVLFLFCGRRTDRIKGLLWEGDGFLLLYKRLQSGSFSWPRSDREALAITRQQYRMLMAGLQVAARHPIKECRPQELL
jgi:transposase